MYTFPIRPDEIYHSGKGHDDNPPGRGSGRYPWGSGERPYQDDKNALRNYRQELIDKRDQRIKDEQDYEKRRQQIKNVAIGLAAVVGVGAAVYLTYRYSSTYQINQVLKLQRGKDLIKDAIDKAFKETDIVFKSGDVLHRMSAYADIDYSKVKNPLYVSYKEEDVLKYMGYLKDFSGTNKRYDVTLKAIKDLKGPTEEKARKIFEEFISSNPEYKKKLTDTITDVYYDMMVKGGNIPEWQKREFRIRAMENAKDMVSNDFFKAGIYSITLQKEDSKQLIQEFAKRGYDFIEDYFDKGDFTDSPMILFDPSSQVVKLGEERVTEFMKRDARLRLKNEFGYVG